MYNGLEGVAVKGTGLSGYVERSRVHIQQRPRRWSEGGKGEGRSWFGSTETGEQAGLSSSSGASINPLEVQRSHRENKEMAARFARHKARRQVLLRVLEYKDQRSREIIKRRKEEEERKREELGEDEEGDLLAMEGRRGRRGEEPTISEDLIEREGAELYKSLMEEVERQEYAEDQKIKEKSAASFAAAFEVRGDHHNWDYARLLREKQQMEEQRREKAQVKVAERIKRFRQEMT